MQINLKLSEKMFLLAKTFSERSGFDTLQDFIRETLREKLFESQNENIGGIYTLIASEEALAKNWNTKEEDEAWQHLQKEI